jgi:cytochrome c-type biogenesis protein CcmH/NrfG
MEPPPERALIEQALAAEPKNLRLLWRLAEAFERERDFDTAESLWQQLGAIDATAAAVDPAVVGVEALLALAAFEYRRRNFPAAERAYERASPLLPGNPELQVRLMSVRLARKHAEGR